MRYAIWNNKGGVGKTFLTFILGTEFARNFTDTKIILVDMCPQANLSEIVLGGNGAGAAKIEQLIQNKRTIGGYFDSRISQPHKKTGDENSFLLRAKDFNNNLQDNIYLICGDPSLEIQAQVISQISSQTLPSDSWKSVHLWLKDLIQACIDKEGNCIVFIDCNPSFSAYTELAMVASDRLIIPCSSDGSSARAIDNVGSLLYGVGQGHYHNDVGFPSQVKKFSIPLPLIHSIILYRSTQYNKGASKAFKAMFDKIKDKVRKLLEIKPEVFVSRDIIFLDMPDSHSVSIVCSHEGISLNDVKLGKHEIYDVQAQVNEEPLKRYKEATDKLIKSIRANHARQNATLDI